uniref:Ion channel n=1 Tax=Ascaris lumbricoides TaxID=6252 RepID=A0A0M3I3K6_ASCLU
MRRFLSPHLLLVVSCGLYMVIGAWIFQALEGHNLKNVKAERSSNIEKSSDRYLDRIWELAHSPEYQDMDPQKLKDTLRKESKSQFNEYVDMVFAAHRTFRHGYENDAPSWDFLTSFFFTATMLTSIGYGYVAPFTFYGRLFGVVYCLIGIPLTLVTVANIAKFISETVFRLHYELWRLWMRWKERKSPGLGVDEESRAMFGESEDEQEILDRVKLIRFPPFVVFLFVFLYGLLGAYIIHKNEQQWSYTESMYFTFISILTVGFGDYRPAPTNLMTVLLVIMGGIILTTMCMDVVGRMYLKEIHYIGRKLKSNNPFYLIREAKARRRRQAMASLLAQLARGMIFAHRNYSELAYRKERVKERRRGSHVRDDVKQWQAFWRSSQEE